MTYIGSSKFEEAVALHLNSWGTVERFRVYQVDPAAQKGPSVILSLKHKLKILGNFSVYRSITLTKQHLNGQSANLGADKHQTKALVYSKVE